MRPRRSDHAVHCFAPAKINLFLDVLGRRADGFHELITLVAPVSLGDRISWSPATDAADGFRLQLVGQAASLPADDRNLAHQAATALATEAGIEPHGTLRVEKNIPAEAGLGGASSDAAATLATLNTAWGLRLPLEKLAALGARLGSDVALFFAGGPAICRGRGERVEPLGLLPPLDLVIAKPRAGVSTAEAFGRLHAVKYDENQTTNNTTATLNQSIDAWRSGSLGTAALGFANRLQGVATQIADAIDETLDRLAWAAAAKAWMTGSGSACVALAHNRRHAATIAGRLRATRFDGTAFVVTTR